MAGAREVRNKINDEFLTCQICLNVYVEPVLLDCQHSFCRSCVSQCLPTISGSLHCPVCRQKTRIPKKMGLAILKKNFFLQSLIDTFAERRNSIASVLSNQDVNNSESSQTDTTNHDRVTSSSYKKVFKKDKRLCENCVGDKGLAVSRCLDCTDFLCRDCELVHCHTKFTRQHKIVPLRELRTGDYSSEFQARAKVFCTNHPGEICRQVCVQCCTPYCHDCLTENHQEHTTKSLKDFVAEQKLRLEKSLQKSTIEENFNNENLKKFIKEREKEVAEKKIAIQEIQKRTKAIIAASKSHEDKVIKGIKDMSKKKKKYLINQEDNCKLKLELIQNKSEIVKENSKDILQYGTPVEILSLKPYIDELESALEDNQCQIHESKSLIKSEWKLCPEIEEMETSVLLVKIKSVLKNLIGFVEGSAVDSQDFTDILVMADFSSSLSSSLSVSNSPTAMQNNNYSNDGYCYMRSLLQNGNNKNLNQRISGSSFNTTDDENLEMKGKFQKMNPLRRRKINTNSESPSLNLMRKFPPKLNISNEVKEKKTQFSKLGDSFERQRNGLSEEVLGCSRQDTNVKNNNVIQWNLRSKSEDRFANDVIQNEITRGRPKATTPKETNMYPAARGRKRHRSLPGSANYSTQHCISTASESINSLLSLATSPVAALAEKPARLGIYNMPDPTSDAAVSCLTKTISTVQPSYDTNLKESICGTQSFHHVMSNILVKSFQLNGKATTFKSAPKLSCTQNGQIICTDYKAQRLFLFNTDGTLAHSFKTKCSGIKSLHPISASAVKKEKILVACGDGVYKFTANGKFSKKFGIGCFKKCCGIAADPRTGKIIVTDIDKKCVSIHDSEGGLVRIFKGESSLCNGNIGGGTRSSNSEEALKLQTPYFVAIDKSNGNIIVSDWASNDVKVFDQDGNFLTSLCFCSSSHPFSPPRDEFSNPAGICCDDDGNIFVADHGKNRVAMFNNNWQFLKFIATDKDGLQTPWSVVTISNKRLCVSEYWSRIIKVFPY